MILASTVLQTEEKSGDRVAGSLSQLRLLKVLVL